ncbi:MAG: hypothetical protein ACLFV3_10450 [Phycisphaeraceae bacterium]
MPGYVLLAGMALCYVLSGVYGAGAGPGPFRFVDLALGCLALLLGWAGWADPLLAPVPRPRRSSPRMVLLTRKVQIWLVPLCLLMLVGLLTTFATEVLGLPETPLTRGMLGIGVAGAMVVGLLVSKRIAELHEQRYRRGIRERGLCFACGYDLRGRPDGGREGVQNAGRWWPSSTDSPIPRKALWSHLRAFAGRDGCFSARGAGRRRVW